MLKFMEERLKGINCVNGCCAEKPDMQPGGKFCNKGETCMNYLPFKLLKEGFGRLCPEMKSLCLRERCQIWNIILKDCGKKARR